MAVGILAILSLIGLYLGALHLSGNFHEVLPGELYRSAQLKPGDIAHYAHEYQIKTIINLRGDNTGKAWYDQEVAEAKTNHIIHTDFRMSAKHELTAARAAELIEVMRSAEKPLLIHCQAGADRSGLAVALYFAAIKKMSETASELQLSIVYGHLPLWFSPAYAMSRTFEKLEPSLGFFDS